MPQNFTPLDRDEFGLVEVLGGGVSYISSQLFDHKYDGYQMKIKLHMCVIGCNSQVKNKRW
jgi:hypothetical protein